MLTDICYQIAINVDIETVKVLYLTDQTFHNLLQQQHVLDVLVIRHFTSTVKSFNELITLENTFTLNDLKDANKKKNFLLRILTKVINNETSDYCIYIDTNMLCSHLKSTQLYAQGKLGAFTNNIVNACVLHYFLDLIINNREIFTDYYYEENILDLTHDEVIEHHKIFTINDFISNIHHLYSPCVQKIPSDQITIITIGEQESYRIIPSTEITVNPKEMDLWSVYKIRDYICNFHCLNI